MNIIQYKTFGQNPIRLLQMTHIVMIKCNSFFA